MKDAQFLAYPPVVAAGNNANIIHYINNTQVAKDGDLVLMDAGSFPHLFPSRIETIGVRQLHFSTYG